jgi:hypothetical protein
MPNAEIVRTQMNVMPPFPYIHVETTPKREWDPSGENFKKQKKKAPGAPPKWSDTAAAAGTN